MKQHFMRHDPDFGLIILLPIIFAAVTELTFQHRAVIHLAVAAALRDRETGFERLSHLWEVVAHRALWVARHLSFAAMKNPRIGQMLLDNDIAEPMCWDENNGGVSAPVKLLGGNRGLADTGLDVDGKRHLAFLFKKIDKFLSEPGATLLGR